MIDRRLVSIAEAAERLGISRSRLYELMQEGSLPTVRIGKRRLLASDALDAFITEHEEVEAV